METGMVVGAGKRGETVLRKMVEAGFLIKLVVDPNPAAPGIRLAEKLGISAADHWKEDTGEYPDLVVDATGDPAVLQTLLQQFGHASFIVSAETAVYILGLRLENEKLADQLANESARNQQIFHAASDGIIGIDAKGKIVIFNKSAEQMIGVDREEAEGKPVEEVIPGSRLPAVLASGKMEIKQEQILGNGIKIITTRLPVVQKHGGAVIGAAAIFKDISQTAELAGQITSLKEVQTMLNAIIQSSDDAISVVDEKGRGLLINRAYTRLTGLTENELIGKPATVDISEGEESMHMRVLLTRKPVRGVNMKLGQNRKEVIVNVAPIIVDGQLKGSVGVVHDVSEIRKLNQELDDARRIIRTLEAKYTFEDIIGSSEETRLAIDQAKLSARTPATVLLRGESGTGKELFAHAIHNASDRKFNKFVRVNCAAIAESLMESELFGYDEGAFSGARRGGKRGFFEEAQNGSIFLDEIGDITPAIQAKLLRVLQENEIVRVGGTKPVPLNVRVIAATNSNLEKAIASGKFREDLYFRLNRMPIYIAPLRKRKEDINELAAYLIQKLNQEYGRSIEGISEGALKKLGMYDWPGNVRELENILGRAIIFMKHNGMMMAADIPDFLSGNHGADIKKGIERAALPLAESMDRYEKEIIEEALAANSGNKTNTARNLGISVRNLYYKMEKHNLEKNSLQ